MQVNTYLTKYQKYLTKRNTLLLSGVTLLLLVGLPIAVFLNSQQQNLMSNAAGSASIEVENGTLAGNVALVNDPNASGGKYMKFGTVQANPTSTPPAGYVVNLTNFGAQCNGVFNNKQAMESAVSDVMGHGGGTLIIPDGNCRIIETSSDIRTRVTGPITFKGNSSNAKISLDTDVQGGYRELFAVSGPNVIFDTLQLVRASNVYGIFINIVGTTSNLKINNVVMDGHKDTIGGADIHGIAINGQAGNQITNTSITNSTLKNVNFGLFQDSNVQSITNGFTVDRSTFTGNYNDDLEFNAPNSTMTNVNVTNSTFSNNKAPAGVYSSGFGVGFANVQHGSISNNTFDGYSYDPIHLEDRTADITVDGNNVSHSGTLNTGWASHVFIITATHDIRVQNNIFDTTGNTDQMWVVYAGAGGGADVSNITISGNTFKLRPNTQAVGNFNVGPSGTTMSNNTIINIP
jgi:hypothetical protein